jgi:hypothetical protein
MQYRLITITETSRVLERYISQVCYNCKSKSCIHTTCFVNPITRLISEMQHEKLQDVLNCEQNHTEFDELYDTNIKRHSCCAKQHNNACPGVECTQSRAHPLTWSWAAWWIQLLSQKVELITLTFRKYIAWEKSNKLC